MRLPRRLNNLVITWFGCGLSPFAPGTVGSIGALPLCWLLALSASLEQKIFTAILVTAIAIFTAAQDQAEGGPRDPGYVVIDEVAGMLWSTLFVSAKPIPMLITFGLFRLFDIWKPWPANRLDKRSKTANSPRARGFFIVIDDVVSGIYACACMMLLPFFHLT